GGGFWVLTPLRLPEGSTVLVNRGFVAAGQRDPATRAAGRIAGPTSVTGLIRMSEPGGAFLRSNDAAADRWFSRDVGAIAAARGLKQNAPYFIDAEATPGGEGSPIGGLTVIAFANNHLVYALTWFTLALMVAAATVFVARDEWRLRASRHRMAAAAGTKPPRTWRSDARA
ncbi:MAG: SURF1 family protein, partial [Phreatobacter sp.]